MTELRARSAYLRVATRRSTPPRPVVPTTPDHHHGDHPHRPLTRPIDQARRHLPPETRVGPAPNRTHQLNAVDHLTGRFTSGRFTSVRNVLVQYVFDVAAVPDQAQVEAFG